MKQNKKQDVKQQGTLWKVGEKIKIRKLVSGFISGLLNKFPDKLKGQILNMVRYFLTVDPWTPEEDQILIDNRDTKTIYELTKLLPNRSFDQIRFRAYTLMGPKVIRTKWDDETKQRIKELKNQGFTNYEIAEQTNKTLGQIVGIVNKEKMSSRSREYKVWTSEENKSLVEMYEKGLTTEEMAEAFNLTSNKIYQKLLHLGYKTSDILTDSKKTKKIKQEEKINQIEEDKPEVKKERKTKAVRKLKRKNTSPNKEKTQPIEEVNILEARVKVVYDYIVKMLKQNPKFRFTKTDIIDALSTRKDLVDKAVYQLKKDVIVKVVNRDSHILVYGSFNGIKERINEEPPIYYTWSTNKKMVTWTDEGVKYLHEAMKQNKNTKEMSKELKLSAMKIYTKLLTLGYKAVDIKRFD